MRKIAVFDFDGTITYKDTLFPFLVSTIGYWGVFRSLFQSSPSLILYMFGIISNESAKQQLIKKSLRGKSSEELRAHSSQWVSSILMRPRVLEQLRWHQNEGHPCILISASVDIYIEYVARYLKFDYFACTGLEVDEAGNLTGQFSTPNCWGEQKVFRLKKIVGKVEDVELFAYGDSAGDIPMLEIAQHAWLNGKQFFKNKG